MGKVILQNERYPKTLMLSVIDPYINCKMLEKPLFEFSLNSLQMFFSNQNEAQVRSVR